MEEESCRCCGCGVDEVLVLVLVLVLGLGLGHDGGTPVWLALGSVCLGAEPGPSSYRAEDRG